MYSALNPVRQPLPDHYLRFRSDDLNEANALISIAYDRHALAPLSKQDNPGISLHHAPLNSVSLSIIEYGADVSVEVERSTGLYVLMPLRGSLEVNCEGKNLLCKPGSGVIVRNGVGFNKLLRGNYAQLVVRFDGAALEEKLAALHPSGKARPISFDATTLLDCNTRKGASWMRTVQYVVDELRNADPDCPQQLIASPLEQLLIQTLYRSQANGLLLADESGQAARPWYVRKAQQYIQDNFTDELGIEALAELTGVSVRSLQYGFKNSIGMTPVQYLKQLRLQQAREKLLCYTGYDSGVTDIALQCGFRQLGRFAKSYKNAFGESPSDTLRRARGR
jgi:AraC-like DNA-binding protein